MALVSINPATGRRIAKYRTHTRAEIERMVTRADVAQKAWRLLAAKQRATFVRALARELRAHAESLATLATDEMGKPITQSRAEVEKCAALCDYYAGNGAALLTDQRPPSATADSRVSYEPLGIVLAIMPWNFPFWQVMRAAVPAILAGNAVLLKHAPGVPGCSIALQRLFAQAKFPPGVFQALLTDTRPVPMLIDDSRIAGVTLTGSVRAGKAVASLAGTAMKPCVFELGGSDPILVLEDADLARAAELAAAARLINSGQSCICGKRTIVVRTVLREFEQQFTAAVARRRVGNPVDPANEVGPLARADLRDALVDQVRRSVRKGARVLLEGGPVQGPGYYYSPTVLTNVGPGMAAFDEETFGPVAAIVPARDEAHAIRLANATRFGLGAAVFTRNAAHARRVVSQLQAGCVFVNDTVRSAPELPFGGIKESGYGRELAAWGLHSFVNVKTIVGA